MTTAPLRIAFAGANAGRGWAYDAHLAAVRALPGLKVQAVLARTEQLAESAAEAFGAVSAYSDLAVMLGDPEIDVVAVTVRVPEHRAIVLAALQAGKHVYCEWPLGCDLAEAKLLAEAANRSSLHVVIGTQAVLAPAIRHAAQVVRGGAIGELLNLRVVSATAGWGTVVLPCYEYLEDQRNGATFSDIAGGHTIAGIEALVGPYTELSAMNSTLRKAVRVAGTDRSPSHLCPDHMMVIGRHASGCVSSLEVLGGVADAPFRFELRGSKGSLEIAAQHPGGFQCSNLLLAVTPEASAQPAPATALTGNPANVAEVWAAFAADVCAGKPTVPDFNAAVRLTFVLRAIDAAAASGQRVTV